MRLKISSFCLALLMLAGLRTEAYASTFDPEVGILGAIVMQEAPCRQAVSGYVGSTRLELQRSSLSNKISGYVGSSRVDISIGGLLNDYTGYIGSSRVSVDENGLLSDYSGYVGSSRVSIDSGGLLSDLSGSIGLSRVSVDLNGLLTDASGYLGASRVDLRCTSFLVGGSGLTSPTPAPVSVPTPTPSPQPTTSSPTPVASVTPSVPPIPATSAGPYGVVSALTPPVFLRAEKVGRYIEIHFPVPNVWDTWGVTYSAHFAKTGDQFCAWTAVVGQVTKPEGHCSAVVPKNLKGKKAAMYIQADSDLGKVVSSPFTVRFK